MRALAVRCEWRRRAGLSVQSGPTGPASNAAARHSSSVKAYGDVSSLHPVERTTPILLLQPLAVPPNLSQLAYPGGLATARAIWHECRRVFAWLNWNSLAGLELMNRSHGHEKAQKAHNQLLCACGAFSWLCSRQSIQAWRCSSGRRLQWTARFSVRWRRRPSLSHDTLILGHYTGDPGTADVSAAWRGPS